MELDQLINSAAILGPVAIVACVCGVIGLIAVAAVIISRRARPKKSTIKNGVDGTATILSAEWTNVRYSGMPEYKFLVSVNVPGWEPYQTTHKRVVTDLVLPRVNVGMTVPVKVDPNNRDNLEFVITVADRKAADG